MCNAEQNKKDKQKRTVFTKNGRDSQYYSVNRVFLVSLYIYSIIHN